MGRASRWLKGLFGIKKEKEPKNYTNSGDRKNKNTSCVGRSRREPTNSPATEPWFDEEEQSKHAIAVAAATAAAADAAVAAAQAAVAVVRLTSQGRHATTVAGAGAREILAAIKIQSLFRAYLSRKALRALKGLVKVQALVRGYLVRKQAAATLHGMEALIRAQSNVFTHKFHSNFNPRPSIESFDETRSEYTSIHSRRLSSSFETFINHIDESPKIVEVDPGRPNSRSRRTNTWAWAPDYTYAQSVAHLSTPNLRNFNGLQWAPLTEECHFSTAQSTPRFTESNGFRPVTPSRSICTDGSFSNHPNYMANTKSSMAKLRSHSAPKQRPCHGFGPKNNVSLNEMMESRNSISCGVKMSKSNSQEKEVNSFKNVVIDRIGRSSEIQW